METGAKTKLHWITKLLLPACLLAGCSGIKPYPNNLENNLHLHTKTDSGSLFSSVRAAVDIYQVNARCQPEYQGTVDLDKSSLAIGIPIDQTSYLNFGFASSSWLANSNSTISYETLLTPRAGYDYDIEVTYLDDIYHVAILETHQRNSIRRDIEQQTLSDCISR
jgi:hypothetical protein